MNGHPGRACLYLLLPALVILPASGDPAADAVGQRVAPRVAPVRVSRGSATATGNAFRIADRLYLTAAHTLREARAIVVLVPGADALSATVVSESPEHDLALLQVARSAGKAGWLALQPSRSVRPGEELAVISRRPAPSPSGEARNAYGVFLIPARSEGWSNRPGPAGTPLPQLVLDAQIERGDSGSPVVRLRDGSVVGIATHRESPVAGIGSATAFAVPTELAVPLLSRAGEPVGWAQAASVPRVSPATPRPARSSTALPPPPGRSDEFYLLPLARRTRPGD